MNRLPHLAADDLLLLLEVARSGRYTTAAQVVGVNHTTVSRRIAALERRLGGRLLARSSGGWELTPLGRRAVETAERIDLALRAWDHHEDEHGIRDVVRLSATDGFSAYVAAPAAARLRARHPGLAVEIVAATRRAAAHRSGLDLEVVVGEPRVHRAQAQHLGPYTLALYASTDHLDRHGSPTSREDLARHGLVYFIDSMLEVDELDVARRHLPDMQEAVTSTNVFVHVEATRAGAGVGMLPCFMAERHGDLHRVLPEVSVTLGYWLVTRPEAVRRPAVAAVVDALRETVHAMAADLLGAPAD